MVARLGEDWLAQGLPAAAIGPTLTKGYAKLYRRLPVATPGIDKSQIPMLYSLLGSGPAPLKMSKEDACYQDRPVGGQRCGTCSSSYRQLVTGELICSQLQGLIEEGAYCRLWNTDRH